MNKEGGLLENIIDNFQIGEIKNYRINRELRRLDESRYIIIKDFSLDHKRKRNIDYIILSDHGIFIIKEKRKRGIIFGYDKDYFWNEKSLLGTHKFFNPIIENYERINDLKRIINSVKPLFYYNVILFTKNPEIYVEQTVENESNVITTLDKLVEIIEDTNRLNKSYINKKDVFNKIIEHHEQVRDGMRDIIGGAVKESENNVIRNIINRVS
ncbi:MAG: nuclease-related domain-containing protein [Peptostreptococcales bacterium]